MGLVRDWEAEVAVRDAEIERLRKHQRAITDSALRYDEAVGRLCPRDEIIDYHDDLLLAIDAAREGEG